MSIISQLVDRQIEPFWPVARPLIHWYIFYMKLIVVFKKTGLKMLKNIYFAFSIAIICNLLHVNGVIASEQVANQASSPQGQNLPIPGVIDMIADYCKPTEELHDVIVENPTVNVHPLLNDYHTDSYLELLFKRDNSFGFHTLLRGRTGMPYYWANYAKNGVTGTYDKGTEGRDMLLPWDYHFGRRVKDNEFEEQIRDLNKKEIDSGELSYNSAARTTYGITSQCTFTPTEDKKSFKVNLRHDTAMLASAIDQATNQHLTKNYVKLEDTPQGHPSKDHQIKPTQKPTIAQYNNALFHATCVLGIGALAARVYLSSRAAKKDSNIQALKTV